MTIRRTPPSSLQNKSSTAFLSMADNEQTKLTLAPAEADTTSSAGTNALRRKGLSFIAKQDGLHRL